MFWLAVSGPDWVTVFGMTSHHTTDTAHADSTVELPTGLADPEMRLYAAFVGVIAVVVSVLFWVPGIG